MNKNFKVDPVSVEVIRNAFISAARDMNAILIRGAYSEVIYEMKDCSVGIFDSNGDLLGQSPGLPVFLGILDAAVDVVITEIGTGCFLQGDVYILNDPYLTGSHLNDVVVLMPLFFDNTLVGFSVAKAHFLDVGAMEPGDTNKATQIYQEGCRFGPTQIVEGGRPLDDVIDLLIRNSRFPRQAYGDLWAMIAACRVGEKRFCDLLSKFELETVKSASAIIMSQCEEMDSIAVEAIPDGRYRAEGLLDNDGQDNTPVPVKVTLVIKGKQMLIDLSESSAQTKGCLNCGLPATISAARMVFKYLINPHSAITGGTFRNLNVITSPGSIFNAREPAACQYYFPHLGLMIDLIFQALAHVIPDKVIASQCADAMNIMFTGFNPRDQKPFICGEATAVGWGAHEGQDGENGMINYGGGDLKNFPAEVIENRYPLLIWKYGLLENSGGAGKFRGGLGIVRKYETLSDTLISTWFERTKTPGLGILGGLPGSLPEVTVDLPFYNSVSLLKANSVLIPSNVIVEIKTGGGGGYRCPNQRDPALIQEDLFDGYITDKYALTHHGYSSAKTS